MHFYLTAFALFPHLLNFAYGLSVRASKTTAPPISYGMVLYPNFEPADVFGPLDIFGLLSSDYRMRLSLIAATLDPVSTKPTVMNLSGSDFGESIVPTHTFSTPPEDIEVLFVPGGGGTRSDAFIGPAIGFVGRMYPKLKYLITVCNGATIGARSGVLDGRRATTSKRDWAWVSSWPRF
ncbi:hypothetical protein AOQ84DRAFT_351332 [Glonium stellatum]|uniref:DJ-1/PfpI domain-containing protein n=1 Tax=Glonium stellatum TaxID=574774 RepID=A0A8E2FCT8_9PEZI|nr:hypothetical protein AOQ84DRAFT_351332 [Glonium stellatum]